jgi:hypothetical protein
MVKIVDGYSDLNFHGDRQPFFLGNHQLQQAQEEKRVSVHDLHQDPGAVGRVWGEWFIFLFSEHQTKTQNDAR